MRGKRRAIYPTRSHTTAKLPLQDIVDHLEDELLVVDGEYHIRLANSSAEVNLQPESPLIGGICYQVLHRRDSPCSTPLWDCPLRQVFDSGDSKSMIHPIAIGGTTKCLKITAYPLKDNDGSLWGMVEIRREVTAERELESQVLRRHHQLLILSRISNAVANLLDLEAILRNALDNVLEIVDGTVGGILLLDDDGKTLRYCVHRGLSSRYAEEMRMSIGEGIAGRVVQSGEPIVLEDVARDSRTVRPDLVSAEGLKGFVSIPLKSRDRIVGVMNVASHSEGWFGMDDVSLLNSIGDYLGTAVEQARLYERLAKAGERYRLLLRHALTAQEEERKRISRELHDETSQAITSLTLGLHAATQVAEMKGIGDADFVAKLKTMHMCAVRAGNEIVKLMKEMRPTLLDELGMPAAIHRYAKETLQSKGINVSTEFCGVEGRFPPEIEVTLFRIAQGALGNILEHSEAKNAAINLKCSANECVLRIEDNGKGFDVSQLTGVDSRGRGAGLFTMKERVTLVGGSCHVESQPGQGTKVIINVPVVRAEPFETDKSADSR